ncbi:cell division protein FtsI/penicillin-binding protein 2 [Alkalibacillus flavidus]|uniref:serine-type D-Ala-D-Ala carboxypeptidase n=1 Tax=Alkalibacillus flavidus TaxID=546021 RepID=A0ABV2KXG9_9BACI
MKQKQGKSHLPLRLNLLFFFIFLLFSLLILQLGVIQILYGQDAQEEINRTNQDISETPVPRGRMFDRNGELVVDNEPVLAITYTPPKNVQPDDNLELAQNLIDYISMPEEDIESVTERDLKDYLLLDDRQTYYDRLTEAEKDLDDDEKYQAVLDHINESDLDKIGEEELEIVALFRKLNRASALTPYIIQRGEAVTNEEYAIIAEHVNQFPGVNVATDWERQYLYDNTFKSFLGSIEKGLPNDRLDYFLSHNYKRNDRVGRNGLEEYYELQLSGKKEIREHITDSSGNVITSEVVREGERGKDLVLSVDMELQQRLDTIVAEELQEAIEENPYENRYMESAMAVMMDPNTGEVLAMSGQAYDREAEGDEPKVNDESFRAIYNAYVPGSVVKGATVLAGLDSGVISPGEVIRDRTIQLPPGTANGDLSFSSWSTTLGSLNDIGALRESSNVYMGFIALRMNGEMRHRYDFRNSGLDESQQAYADLENYYSQFGLGVETGVDLPYESSGYEGVNDSPGTGLQMQYAIGQYHSYTTLQLGQYVSTIANDGYRLAPSLVKRLHSAGDTAGLGPLYDAKEPEVLNRIDMNSEYIDRVQEGFRQAFQEPGGTGRSYFADKAYNPAGKTGTAETKLYEDGKEIADVNNLNLVGYAPYDNPEVAFAVMVPHTGPDADHSTNLEIGERAMDAYFELKEERQSSDDELEEQMESPSTN